MTSPRDRSTHGQLPAFEAEPRLDATYCAVVGLYSEGMAGLVHGWERWQVALYLAAIGGGALLGISAPSLASVFGAAITPLLGALLLVTFLGIPLVRLGRALRDLQFLLTVLVVNFVIVPAIVFVVSRPVADDRALLLGVLLVLLTPCVDYVIVFTGLAGGSRERLLAATPLLLVLQMVLLPLYLLLLAGGETVALIDPVPFVQAFVFLIAIPLAFAAVVQLFERRGIGEATAIVRHSAVPMVPLMVATLVAVVASQIVAVTAQLDQLLRLVPLYLAFLVVMVAIGMFAGRAARLDIPATRALVFSGVTRNSLVVLPLALALPAGFALAPLAVVTQTLVELVGMTLLVRIVPRILPEGTVPRAATPPIVYR